MRVLHIVSRLAYYGAENFVRELAQALHGRHAESCVLTLYESPTDATASISYPELAIRRRGRYDVGFFSRMVGAIRSWKPEVVNTHVHNGKYWGRVAALTAGVRCIVHTEHNSAFSAHPAAVLGNRILHPLTAAVVALSPTHARSLAAAEHLDPARITVIPNGISRREPDSASRSRIREELRLDTGVRLILHVGRLTAVKNQRLALAAFARLRSSVPAVRLAFAGDGEDEAALRAFAEASGVGDAVMFLGFRRDVRTLLTGADALLVTSTNEAMPIAVLEAFFAGLPVVSTPWLGSDDLFGQGRFGLVVSDASAQAVSHGLESVLLGPASARARLVAAQMMARDRYDITQTARRYSQLYRSLVHGQPDEVFRFARTDEP